MLSFPNDFNRKAEEERVVQQKVVLKEPSTIDRTVVYAASITVVGLAVVTRQPIFITVLLTPLAMEVVEMYKNQKKVSKK